MHLRGVMYITDIEAKKKNDLAGTFHGKMITNVPLTNSSLGSSKRRQRRSAPISLVRAHGGEKLHHQKKVC